MSSTPVTFKDFNARERDLLLQTARKVLTETSLSKNDIWSSIGRAVTLLPDSLSEKLGTISSPSGVTVLRGVFSVDDVAIGPTPEHWSAAHGDELWDVLLMLASAAMGEPMACEDQQAGRFVHNIVPSRGQETTQTGASSTGLLNPHTEDAFHPDRAHLLVLACMRNHDAVPTTAASIRHVSLSEEDIEVLKHPHLPILPDTAYAPVPFDGEPIPVPVLWSTDEGMMMRFDPSYTPLSDGSPEFSAAYSRLTDELTEATLHCNLNPGDLLVVENDMVAHGRVPFRAKYDGTDRWLKRTLIRMKNGAQRRPAAETEEHGYGHKLLVANLS